MVVKLLVNSQDPRPTTLDPLENFSILKVFLMSSVVILTKVIFKNCIMKYINIWKICINSMSQHFPNDQCRMLQNHIWIKDPFNAQCRPMGVNVTDYEMFVITVSNLTLQLTFKKLPLSNFGVISKNFHNYVKKSIKTVFPFPPSYL